MTQKIASIGAVGVLAATFLAACASDDDSDYDRYCVDTTTNRRVDDRECSSTTHGHTAWYFVSRGTARPAVGEKAGGGSYSVPSRGGFGGVHGGDGGSGG